MAVTGNIFIKVSIIDLSTVLSIMDLSKHLSIEMSNPDDEFSMYYLGTENQTTSCWGGPMCPPVAVFRMRQKVRGKEARGEGLWAIGQGREAGRVLLLVG
jgi:hypothetical protein